MRYKIITTCDNLGLCENCQKDCLNCLNNFVDDYDYLIVDLSDLKQINSFLLSKLMPYMSKVILCGAGDTSLNVIHVMKIDKIIKVVAKVEDAISYVESVSHSVAS